MLCESCRSKRLGESDRQSEAEPVNPVPISDNRTRSRSSSPRRQSRASRQGHHSASRNRGGGQVGGSGQRRAPAEPPKQVGKPPPKLSVRESANPAQDQRDEQASKQNLGQKRNTFKSGEDAGYIPVSPVSDEAMETQPALPSERTAHPM